jgi:hypothetical protein
VRKRCASGAQAVRKRCASGARPLIENKFALKLEKIVEIDRFFVGSAREKQFIHKFGPIETEKNFQTFPKLLLGGHIGMRQIHADARVTSANPTPCCAHLPHEERATRDATFGPLCVK